MRRTVAGIVIGLTLAACSGGKTPTPATPRGESSTSASLKSQAQAVFDSFSAGNYGAVWDRLDISSKQLVTREKYIEVLSNCPTFNEGAPVTIVKVTPNQGGTWSVELRAGGQLVTAPAQYEAGRWTFPFTAEARRRFGAHDYSC